MKIFKRSVALIVAIIAIAFAFFINASALSGKVVTGCWKANSLTMQVRDLANSSSPTSKEIFSPVFDVSDCATVKKQLFVHNKSYLRVAAGSPTVQPPCLIATDIFCCLVLNEVSATDPLNADVPAINLGDGARKYMITEVRCHIRH